MKTAEVVTTLTTCCASQRWPNESPWRKGPMARWYARRPCCTISAKARGGRITTCAAQRRHVYSSRGNRRRSSRPLHTPSRRTAFAPSGSGHAGGAGVVRCGQAGRHRRDRRGTRIRPPGVHGTALWKLPWQAIVGGKGDAVRSPDDLGGDYTPVHEFVYKLDRIPPARPAP